MLKPVARAGPDDQLRVSSFLASSRNVDLPAEMEGHRASLSEDPT